LNPPRMLDTIASCWWISPGHHDIQCYEFHPFSESKPPTGRDLKTTESKQNGVQFHLSGL
jgi:hypothetical protein